MKCWHLLVLAIPSSFCRWRARSPLDAFGCPPERANSCRGSALLVQFRDRFCAHASARGRDTKLQGSALCPDWLHADKRFATKRLSYQASVMELINGESHLSDTHSVTEHSDTNRPDQPPSGHLPCTAERRAGHCWGRGGSSFGDGEQRVRRAISISIDARDRGCQSYCVGYTE